MRCQHHNCRAEGEPCYFHLDVFKPDVYYCAEHKEQHGFCQQCGLKLTEEELEDHTGICIPCLMVFDSLPDDSFFTEN